MLHISKDYQGTQRYSFFTNLLKTASHLLAEDDEKESSCHVLAPNAFWVIQSSSRTIMAPDNS